MPFVPLWEKTISKSNCPSAAWLNAAGTVLLAFPSVSPGVIPSPLIAVNLEVAGTQSLVNGQLSSLFGQFVINHFFFFFLCFGKQQYLLLFCCERGEGGSAWQTGTPVVYRYRSTFPLLI